MVGGLVRFGMELEFGNRIKSKLDGGIFTSFTFGWIMIGDLDRVRASSYSQGKALRRTTPRGEFKGG